MSNFIEVSCDEDDGIIKRLKLNKYHISSFYETTDGLLLTMNNGQRFGVLESYETIENLLKGNTNECK
jgi:D-alanine-D-alanine ligase-like ATP-grasp enzyme